MSAARESSVVVWRTGALGDFVLTLPVLSALRERTEHLTIVAPARYQVLFGHADEWIDADGLRATRLFEGAPLDAEIGVAWSSLAADALRRCGVCEVLCGRPHPPSGVHQADSLWKPIAPLLGQRDRDPRIPAVEPVRPGCVVIAPGSGGVRKRWGLDRWRRVASELERVVWVGGPQERDEDGWGERLNPDLVGLIRLASGCRAWLGPDSGPQHLAAAVGARVGVVFNGQTDPRQWGPIGATIFEEAEPHAVIDFARAR